MDLTKAERLANDLMKKHGIDKDWKFEWSRSVMNFGQAKCTWRRGVYHQIINLSKPLTEIRPESEVRMTILHEIAHALVGLEHNHDKVWKAKCLEIGGNGSPHEMNLKDIAKITNYTYHCEYDDEVVMVSQKRQTVVGVYCRAHSTGVIRKRREGGVLVLDTDVVNLVG